MNRGDVITIAGLGVDCVVGVYAVERVAKQRVIVDASIEIDARQAGRTGRIDATVDYAVLAAEISFLLESARFRMLETAAHAIASYVLAPPAKGERRVQVKRVRVKLTKPDALGGMAVPSVEIVREPHEFSVGLEEKKFGTVDVIFEGKEAGIYRLNIAPGKGIPLHVHREMRESEMCLSTGLFAQEKKIARGTVFHWPHGAPHRYDNPTDSWKSILCVDAPRFDPNDEIEVSGKPAEIEPDLRWVMPEAIA